MTFDANGNLTSIIDPSGVATFNWDARDRLVALTGPSLSAHFAYDSLGRRITRQVKGTKTDFLYDGINPVQEQASGTVIANMLTGLRIDEYLVRSDSAGIRILMADALGSTVALLDPSGTVQTTYMYEPFGSTTATGEATANTFQYIRREHDQTELFYYRARYYSPQLHRFISEDPLGWMEA